MILFYKKLSRFVLKGTLSAGLVLTSSQVFAFSFDDLLSGLKTNNKVTNEKRILEKKLNLRDIEQLNQTVGEEFNEKVLSSISTGFTQNEDNIWDLGRTQFDSQSLNQSQCRLNVGLNSEPDQEKTLKSSHLVFELTSGNYENADHPMQSNSQMADDNSINIRIDRELDGYSMLHWGDNYSKNDTKYVVFQKTETNFVIGLYRVRRTEVLLTAQMTFFLDQNDNLVRVDGITFPYNGSNGIPKIISCQFN